LDNTKNDEMYKNLINRNDCADKPLTHVHEEPKTYRKTYTKAQKKPTNNSKKKSGPIGLVVTMIMLLATIIPAIVTIVDELSYGSHEVVTPDYPYSPPESYNHEYWLSPGLHEVGVHIPAGWCEIVLEEGEYANLEVYMFDGENFLLKDFAYLDWSEDTYNFKLEEGEFLSVATNDLIYDSVWLYSDSSELEYVLADSEEMYPVEAYMVAGEDFPAGVYDFVYAPHTENDWGYVDLQVMNPAQTEYMWEGSLFFNGDLEGLYLSEENIYGFHINIPLTPGTVIRMTDEFEGVSIVPSYGMSEEMYDITWGAN
jgi:hypothetical protein